MRLALAALAAFAIAAPAWATETRSAELLQEWPRAGSWSTAMVRTSSRELACYTAAAPISSSSRTLPGLRIKGDELAVALADHDAGALTSELVAVVVDGRTVGTFAVTGRLRGFGVTTVVADVPRAQRDAVMDAFEHGQFITFIAGHSHYTASLARAGEVTNSLHACMDGARRTTEASR